MAETSSPKRKRRKSEPEAPAPEPRYAIPGLPHEDGPMVHHRAIGDTSEIIPVFLPAGVYQYVWELVEKSAHERHQRYASVPVITEAMEVAVRAFRAANVSTERRRRRRALRRPYR